MKIKNNGNKITNSLSNIYNLHTNFNENFEKHQQVKSEKKTFCERNKCNLWINTRFHVCFT